MRGRTRKRKKSEGGWTFGMKPAPTPQQFWIGTAIAFMMGVVFLGAAVVMYAEGQFRYSNGRGLKSRVIALSSGEIRGLHTITETSDPTIFWATVLGFAVLGVLLAAGALATVLKRRDAQRPSLE